MTTYDLTDSQQRRAAQIELCVKRREYHSLAADDFRHAYVRKATGGRTEISKEATLEELNAAIELVAPVLVEDDHVAAAAKRDAQVPEYWARVNTYDENGQLPFSKPRV